MSATRDRLEAVIRVQLSWVAGVTREGAPMERITAVMNQVTETLLREVDEYTTAEVGLLTPAERRAVLYEATS